ncbi:SDR family oxidoreductase [Alicyclobacillus sp. SP_1]|uniref:SDR family oxidoreductase n=1 Tax=Alicyclobacillus sp. SP_1 TaxID=2942475 RepID=UPI0021575013|nr:SDR family oxidoreductase [Alicyclobacillus sp. SP_1]
MSVLDRFRLDGKIALITGGGRGLGLQIARAYQAIGATVVLGSRRLSACEESARELQERGGRALGLELDVTDEGSVKDVVKRVVSEFGKIDILVNNSGASWGAPALEMPLDAWKKVIDTNLTGTFLMSQAVARVMKDGNGGKIINIASVAGLRGTDPEGLDAVPYNASKGGIITLTKDLAVKWARYGIYVNAIAPGFFPTKMTKDVLAARGDHILSGIPLKRYGSDEDLQGAAVYFASSASDYTTGQILCVDGGTTAR